MRHQIPQRERIIASVGDLFYRHGTYQIGIDELVRGAGTTRATLYRHFEGKEALIVAYLEHRDVAVRQELEALVEGLSGEQALLAIFDSIQVKTVTDTFRGCAFLIAVNENPASQPVRDAALAHKLYLHALFIRLLPAGPHHDVVSQQLLVLYEGALAAAALRRETKPAMSARKAAKLILRSAYFDERHP